MSEMDKEFYERADAHIHLANDQLTDEPQVAKVSSSFMFSLARFNAWMDSQRFDRSEDMLEAKNETIDYFMGEYRRMLEQNLDDYIQNFDTYNPK